jgi:FkbM family methyltransferase
VCSSDLSNKATKSITLTTHPHYSGGNTTYANLDVFTRHFSGNSNIITRSILATSLDDIIESFNINSIDLLKIDCEGAEYDILYDSNYFSSNIVKNMVGEFHNLRYNMADNNNQKLFDYSRSRVGGIIIITMLTI